MTFAALEETLCNRLIFKEADTRVKVAVLDTGVCLSHPDFKYPRAKMFKDGSPVPADGEPSQRERIQACQNFCPRPGDNTVHKIVDDLTEDEVSKTIDDLDGHGTHVAGIILRLAPRAVLYIARVCNGDPKAGPQGKDRGGLEDDRYASPRAEVVAEVSRRTSMHIWRSSDTTRLRTLGDRVGYCAEGGSYKHVFRI
jgi:hypothetical protein